MNGALSFILALLPIAAILIAYFGSRQGHHVQTAIPLPPTRHAVAARMLGYTGGCGMGAVILFIPVWLESSLAEGERKAVAYLVLQWGLALFGALAGSLIALAAAAQPSTRSFWLSPVQGLACTLAPAWFCMRFAPTFAPLGLLIPILAFVSAGACWFAYWGPSRLLHRTRRNAA